MLVNRPLLFLIAGVLSGAPPGLAQNAINDPAAARWNVYFQATSIGQHHGAFPSLYEGESLAKAHPQKAARAASSLEPSAAGNRSDEVVRP
jgi:hypothetical protein